MRVHSEMYFGGGNLSLLSEPETEVMVVLNVFEYISHLNHVFVRGWEAFDFRDFFWGDDGFVTLAMMQ